MPDASTLTSIGIGFCFAHPPPVVIPMVGVVITGSPNVNIGGLSSSRTTDIVLGSCGHPGLILIGSGSVLVNGLNKARLSSNFTGIFTGVISTGIPTVQVGG